MTETFDQLLHDFDTAYRRELLERGTAAREIDARAQQECELLRGAWETVLSAVMHEKVDHEQIGKRALSLARLAVDTLPDPVAVRAALVLDAFRSTGLRQRHVETPIDPHTLHLAHIAHDFITRRVRVPITADATPFILLRLDRLGGDDRAVVLLLLDRLQTLIEIPKEPSPQQIAYAEESLTWPSRLAGLAGLYDIKTRIEDFAFRAADRTNYRRVAELVASTKAEREAKLAEIKSEMETIVREAGIPATVQARTKHLYSIHRKMADKENVYSELFDVQALRVVIDGPDDLVWRVQALLVARWDSRENRIKDYIANPKANGYRSLHMTLHDEDDRPFEVQCRTLRMHEEAESGVAAHWAYKQGERADAGRRVLAQSLRAGLASSTTARPGADTPSDDEFRTFRNVAWIFVETPGGELQPLPAGSTALDFAYAIHTDVGNCAKEVKINGAVATLGQELRDGDRCRVIKASEPFISEDRKKLVRTSHAQAKLNALLTQNVREPIREKGRELLRDALKEQKLGLDDLAARAAFRKTLSRRGYSDIDALAHAVGRGHVSAGQVLRWLIQRKATPPPAEPKRLSPGGVMRRIAGPSHFTGAIETSFAGCCDPQPPGGIIGYLSGEGKIVIHRYGCATLRASVPSNLTRLLTVRWVDCSEKAAREKARVRLQVDTTDRPGLLADMGAAIGRADANIIRLVARVMDHGKATNIFDVLVAEQDQVPLLLVLLRHIYGVDRAEIAEDAYSVQRRKHR